MWAIFQLLARDKVRGEKINIGTQEVSIKSCLPWTVIICFYVFFTQFIEARRCKVGIFINSESPHNEPIYHMAALECCKRSDRKNENRTIKRVWQTSHYNQNTASIPNKNWCEKVSLQVSKSSIHVWKTKRIVATLRHGEPVSGVLVVFLYICNKRPMGQRLCWQL